MKRVLLVVALSTFPPQASLPSTTGGSWEGFMQDRGHDQFITLDLAPRPDGSGGALQVLGNTIPVSKVAWAGNRLTAQVGEPADNLRVEARREDGWLTGELKQGERSQLFALREIPDYPEPRNRPEAWQQDIDALVRRVAVLNRSFTAAERSLFVETLETLRTEVGRLTDAQVTMRIASALAIDNEPHTRLLLLRNATAVRRLPIRVWWFPDGLRIIRTGPEYRDLLGCRIDDFEKVPTRLARDTAGQAYAGNASWRDYMTTYTLTSPETLHGFGIVPRLEQIEIGVSDCGGQTRRLLRPLPLARSNRTVESWWDLSPFRESPHGITSHVLPADQPRLPLYLRNLNANYSMEYLAENGVLYVQINRSSPDASESPGAFADRATAEIERRRPKALVLDLRFNTGGDSGVSAELLRRVNESTVNVPRFVITGRATFSAGISAVAQFLSGGPATIVGEPAGDELDHWSEGGYIELPNSRLEVDFQTVLHSYSPLPCPRDISCVDMTVDRIAPDLPVTTSWADYLARHDPPMDAIFRMIGRSSR
ncbi:MAG: hypothetical protein M3R55_07160 [Acidobacteriota bacterium]|nr:hypothetical protein [Acidobacteriota bacterium]